MRKLFLSRMRLLGGALLLLTLSHPALARESRNAGESAYIPIDFPGNQPDTNGYGRVNYRYKVQELRVTNRQYARFLNTVAPEGESPLYHGEMADAPRGGIARNMANPPGERFVVRAGQKESAAAYMSWQDAARYVNWLHNGATATASTEKGAYDLSRAGDGYVERSAGARFWIPNRHELYKASFHSRVDGGVYTPVSRLADAVVEGRFLEITDSTSSLPPVAESAEGTEPVALFFTDQESATALNPIGFRIACRAGGDKEVLPVGEGEPHEEGDLVAVGEGGPPPSAAPAYFLVSPFANPAGPVREARPTETPTPDPSPPPAS